MLISYILDFFLNLFFKHEEIPPCEMWTTMCRMCDVVNYFARDWVNVEAGVSVVAGNFL